MCDGSFNLCSYIKIDSIKQPLEAVNIVMELCSKGSLQRQLLDIQDILDISNSETSLDEINQLHTWALQVALGMEFIASQNVIVQF